jgi:hypothetical protein
MRSSSKRLALTSVAYALTLITVSVVASTQLNPALVKASAAEVIATPEPTVAPAPTKAEILAAYSKQRDQLSDEQLSELLYLVGFTGKAHKHAWAIVQRESNGRPVAHNDNTNTGDNSYGLFQINMIGSLGADRRAKYDLTTNNQLFDPVVNATIAYKMSGGGDDFGSWGLGPNAYRSGAGVSSLKRLGEYPGVVVLTKSSD